jgi:hypothetical protein
MRWLAIMLLAACVTESDLGGPDQSDSPSAEIDGEYLDAEHGVCVGGVGGRTRCSGSPCQTLGERACGRTPSCFIAYSEDAGMRAFRECFPVDASASITGACSTLSATACAGRDDCVAVYTGTSIFSSFVRCEQNRFALPRHD